MDGEKSRAFMDADDFLVADDPRLMMVEHLGKLEAQLDFHSLANRRLLDLKSSDFVLIDDNGLMVYLDLYRSDVGVSEKRSRLLSSPKGPPALVAK